MENELEEELELINLDFIQEGYEYKINEYLKLKYENKKTNIYITNNKKEVLFNQCKYLFLAIPDSIEAEEIDNVDEAEIVFNKNLETNAITNLNIDSRTEFWGHCSNLQAWYDNNYDTRVLHRNLAFPLLKKLTEVGDPLAKKIYKDELGKRFGSGNWTVQQYLVEQKHLKQLTKEELDTLVKSVKTDDFPKRMDLLEGLSKYGSLKAKKIMSKELLKNLNKNPELLHIYSQVGTYLQNMRTEDLDSFSKKINSSDSVNRIEFFNTLIQVGSKKAEKYYIKELSNNLAKKDYYFFLRCMRKGSYLLNISEESIKYLFAQLDKNNQLTLFLNYYINCMDHENMSFEHKNKKLKYTIIETDIIKYYIPRIYNSLIEDCMLTTLRRMRKLTGVEPVFDEKTWKKAFDKSTRLGDVESALDILDLSKLDLKYNEGYVQEGYEQLFKNANIFLANIFYEQTGLAPIFEEGFVQEGYKELLSYGNIKDLMKMVFWSKIAPREDIKQEGYNKLINEKYLLEDKIEEYESWLRITPKKEDLKNGLQTLLEYSHIYNAILKWEKIEPKKDNIDDIYKYLLEKNKIFDFMNLWDYSKILPNFSEEYVQEVYRKSLENKWMYQADYLYKYTHILPKFSENFIQETYKKLLKDVNLDHPKILHKLTNIMPNDESIQAGHKKQLIRGWTDKSQKIIDWIGVKPSKITIQEALDKLEEKMEEMDSFMWSHYRDHRNKVKELRNKLYPDEAITPAASLMSF